MCFQELLKKIFTNFKGSSYTSLWIERFWSMVKHFLNGDIPSIPRLEAATNQVYEIEDSFETAKFSVPVKKNSSYGHFGARKNRFR